MAKFLLFLYTTFFALSTYAVNDAAIKTQWGYKGNIAPERWGQLDPSFALCMQGKSQSPINIGKKVRKTENFLKINYQNAPFIIMDNGETELDINHEQTIINTGHSIQLNFPANKTSESIQLAGKTYQMVQFHFHSPSENTLRGQAYPMEIHFVHQDAGGALAVIGVFVKGGQSIPVIEKIVANLPKDEGVAHEIPGEKINPADLLPVKQDYYSFPGSLTTPPCTEGVQWIMMKDPITATPAQIVSLRKAANGANARPVQPLNKRRILFTSMAE